MSTIKLNGTTSGSSIIKAPDSGSTNQTFTLPDSTGSLIADDGSGNVLVGGTAGAKNITVESTSGAGTISLIQLKNSSDNFNIEVGRTVGALTIRDNTNGERVKLDSSGNLNISSGNLVIGTNGKGIDFSANADSSATGASTTSELLDDYEEGTFTATTTFSSDSISSSNCIYTKVGRMVNCTMYFNATINTVNVNIGGLPFSALKGTTWSVGIGGNRYLEHFGRFDAGGTSLVGTLSGTAGSVEFYVSVTYQTA